MDMKEASLLARNVAKGGWFVVFICFLIMSLAGGTCIFGLCSEAIKIVLGYDQETLATLGFFKDLGGNVGIVSGIINEVTPPWVVLGIGAIMKVTGYMMICLSVTQWIARPKTWHSGANSQTFANTGALVTCVKSFPESRGSLLGILKGFVGLSGAIFNQIYHAIYGQDNTGVVLLLCILPADVFLVVLLIVRLTKVVADKKELKRLFNFFYIELALAGFLMIMIVVENRVKDFPQSGYQIVAALAILFLMFNIVVVVTAEMDNMKLQRLTSQNRNRSHKTVHIDVGEDDEKIKNEEKPKTEINLANFSSENPVKQDQGKSPGIGTIITAVDNMAQIAKAFVSLISIWNFLGCVVEGFLSEFLFQNYKFPRPLIFPIVLLIAFVEHVFTAFSLPGSVDVTPVVLGLCFVAQWPKSLRICLVNRLNFINRKWTDRENKGDGQNKVLKHLPCYRYRDLKEASLKARIVTKRRLFVVFICFLIMSPAEGTFMPRIYSETQSAVGVSNVEKYGGGGDGKHSTEISEGMMNREARNRKILELGNHNPGNPKPDLGPPAQHN